MERVFKSQLKISLKFEPTDEYDSIRRLMTTYLNTGTTHTLSRGRGQRKAKRNERYLDTEDEEEVEAASILIWIKLNINKLTCINI